MGRDGRRGGEMNGAVSGVGGRVVKGFADEKGWTVRGRKRRRGEYNVRVEVSR